MLNRVTKIADSISEIKYAEPVIITVNKFTETSAREFSEQMSKAHNTGQDVIPIVIDSFGGDVYSLLSMVSAIEQSEIPVVTIVEGKAMSCGAILFSFGEERYMSRHASILIHDVSSWVYGKVGDMKIDVDECIRLNKLIYKMLDDNCKKKSGYFSKLVEKKNRVDWYLTAKTAKKHNLATTIGVPRGVCTVDVNFKLEG